LEHARSKIINPNIDGNPEYFGFHQDDVDRYGYYFLFLIDLPAYAENIWYLENAAYLHLLPLKENARRRDNRPRKLQKRMFMKNIILTQEAVQKTST
jgi:hypothetical protein